MYRIRINNINEFANKDKDVTNAFGGALIPAREYITNNIVTNFPYRLSPSYDVLIYDNDEVYFAFNPRTFLKPICNLVEIDYVDTNDGNEIEYNVNRIQHRIIELKSIQDEHTLMIKYPSIYEEYKKRLEQTQKAISIYSQYRITFPKKQAYETMRKNIYDSNMNDEIFNKLLSEAAYLSIPMFVSKVTYDATLLLGNVYMLNSLVCNILLEPPFYKFDIKKIKSLKKHY